MGKSLLMMAAMALLASCTTLESSQPTTEGASLPETLPSLLDLTSPRIIKIERDKFRRDADGAVEETVVIENGVVLNARLTTGVTQKLVLHWSPVPDGGAGTPPMFRMSVLLNQVPLVNLAAKRAAADLAAAAAEIAHAEGLDGNEKRYDVACGTARCLFQWTRASDGALSMEASR